ncbi:MAG: M56 family metallopeptidase [Bacteroidales bacterium]
MTALFSYITELNIAITLFFLVYLLVFRKDSNFNGRRIFLLLAMGISILIPFIQFRFNNPAVLFNSPMVMLEEVIFTGQAGSHSFSRVSPALLLMIIYLAVSIFYLGRLILNISGIIYTALHAERSCVHGRKVIVNNRLHPSSFFKMIFIDPAIEPETDLRHILDHESYHVRLWHSVDRIMAEFLICISWFNPVIWMVRKSIVVNHEYQADNRVVTHGADQVSYQLTILNQFIGSASISNQFSNQIKNRINMLNKNYKKGSFWKSMVLIPVSGILLFFMACGNEPGVDNTLETEVFYVVEEMPEWPGSDDMAHSLRTFIAENLKYPEEAKNNGVEGRVMVHFMVTKTGKVIVPDPSILPPEKDEEGNIGEVVVVSYMPYEGVRDPVDEKLVQLLKDESVRVIELLPDLKPGKQGNKAVNVLFTMPINFKLQ